MALEGWRQLYFHAGKPQKAERVMLSAQAEHQVQTRLLRLAIAKGESIREEAQILSTFFIQSGSSILWRA